MKEIYYDYETKNASFLKLTEELKSKGIENNQLPLILLDKKLQGVDPYSDNLEIDMKTRIFKECCHNYWYFIRECVRVKQDDTISNYNISLEELKLHFCMVANFNIITNMTFNQAICIRLIWEFAFGTTRTYTSLLDESHKKAKNTLAKIKDLYHLLPEHLKIGKLAKNNVDLFENDMTYNIIRAVATPKRKNTAQPIGRGLTQPRQWYNDFINIAHSDIIHASSGPAFWVASENARRNANVYGIIITTDLDINTDDVITQEIQDVSDYINTMRVQAAEFSDSKLDWKKHELDAYIKEFSCNNFMYIR